MLRDLYLAIAYLSFIALGFAAPFVATLGYVWVDTFQPQSVAYSLLAQIPASQTMAIAALVLYVLLDRKAPPRPNMVFALNIVMGLWVTLANTWAVLPDAAWEKWSLFIKTIGFAAFIPFVIRSRTQIESFLLVYIFSLSGTLIPYGLKTLVSGGGYGYSLGLVAGNSGLGEGSTLCAYAVGLVPLLLWARTHATLIPSQRLRNGLFLTLVVLAVLTAIGTHERTALVVFGVVGVFLWIKARRKVLFTFGAALLMGLVFLRVSSDWTDRISTVQDYRTEQSANNRLEVWKWTWNFVQENPLGGGFQAYTISKIPLPPSPDDPGAPRFLTGLAYHNMFVEVLGEFGFPGLAIYMSLVGYSLLTLRRVAKSTKKRSELAWLNDLATALTVSLLTVVAGSQFVANAFQPMIWYLFALSTCLQNHLARATAPTRPGIFDVIRRPAGALPAGSPGASIAFRSP